MKKTLGLILGILFLASVIFFFIITGWYVAGAIFIGFCVIFAAVAALKERYETRCSKCKTKYDYDSDVEYQELRRWVKGPSSTNDTFAQMFYKVEFNCECSNCGTKKRYIKKIEGPKITGNGDYVDNDPEYAIMERFGKAGGEVSGIALLILPLLSAAFVLGGLFFSGNLNIPFLSDFNAVIKTENVEDPADYYNKYYYTKDSILKTIEFTASGCTITTDMGIRSKSETYSYKYMSAEYAAVHLNFEKPEFANYDLLFVYADANREDGWAYWVMNVDNGKYTLIDFDNNVITTEVLTFEDVMEDPKNYYGSYTLDNFFVTINADGTAILDLGEGEEAYLYMYVTQDYLQTYLNKNYQAALVLYTADSDQAIIFNYQNGELILNDQYIFTK